MSDLRLECVPASAPVPAALAVLIARLGGLFDHDPIPESCERWLAWRGDELLAHASTTQVADLHGAPGISGLVGHYGCAESPAGVALLRAAAAKLLAGGARRVLGPMNGNTWRRYRLALPPAPGDPGPEAPWFLSEPRNPPSYPSEFEAAGFIPVAHYESRIESPIQLDEARRVSDRVRFTARGITVRSLDPARFDDELRAIWELSIASFSENAWYSPIPFEDFLALYRPLRPLIDPGLVLLAHAEGGGLAGFMLAFVDPATRSGEVPGTLICKSMAVSPAARGLGLGAWFLSEVRSRGARLGCTAVIDALMHVSNVSRVLSQAHGSRLFRRYALYEWAP